MNSCIIGIGSNVNAEENIPRSLQLLAKDLKIIGVSKMVKTKPIGFTAQEDFTNGAVKVETSWSRRELIQYLKKLEDRMGRDRSGVKSGPRTIDLDMVVWNGKVVDPDYYTRDFLRQSTAELGFTDGNK